MQSNKEFLNNLWNAEKVSIEKAVEVFIDGANAMGLTVQGALSLLTEHDPALATEIEMRLEDDDISIGMAIEYIEEICGHITGYHKDMASLTGTEHIKMVNAVDKAYAAIEELENLMGEIESRKDAYAALEKEVK